MSHSRITMIPDAARRLIIIRYFGDMEGGEINESLMDKVRRVEAAWSYDTILDMRRYQGTVKVTEIEQLSQVWALFAQGRDAGRLTAVISTDVLVLARRTVTQGLFPQRNIEYFATFDQGLDWIATQRRYIDKAMAG